MQAEVTHPDTGERVVVDIPGLTESQIREIAKEHATQSQLLNRLDNLPLSADGKAFLAKCLKITIKIGGTVVKLGKKVVEIAMYLMTKLPHLTFWTVLGAVFAFLITSIPILGAILGSFLSPLIMVAGLSKGFYEQLIANEPQAIEVIDRSTASFRPLNPATS